MDVMSTKMMNLLASNVFSGGHILAWSLKWAQMYNLINAKHTKRKAFFLSREKRKAFD